MVAIRYGQEGLCREDHRENRIRACRTEKRHERKTSMAKSTAGIVPR